MLLLELDLLNGHHFVPGLIHGRGDQPEGPFSQLLQKLEPLSQGTFQLSGRIDETFLLEGVGGERQLHISMQG